MKHLVRNILIAVLVGVVFYAAMTIWADARSVADSFAVFQWGWVPLILALTFFNYFLRFWKWHYYIKRIGVNIPWTESMQIFLSGLSLSVTPYKAGEVVKSYLLKERCGVAISRTAPVVLAERLTDLTGLVLLAAIGAVSYSYGETVVIITVVLVLAFVVLIQYKKACLKILGWLSHLPVIKKHTENMLNLYESTYELLRPVPTAVATLASVVSWFAECAATYLVIIAFGAHVTLLQATFVFAFSSIAGAVVFLPGGLGVAEVSMAGILIIFGIDKGIAVSATLIIRLCTLWFGVFIGIFTITRFMKKLTPAKVQESPSVESEGE